MFGLHSSSLYLLYPFSPIHHIIFKRTGTGTGTSIIIMSCRYDLRERSHREASSIPADKDQEKKKKEEKKQVEDEIEEMEQEEHNAQPIPPGKYVPSSQPCPTHRRMFSSLTLCFHKCIVSPP